MREVEDGGATSRRRTFLLQSVFFMYASVPLFILFPVAPIALTASYYGAFVSLGLVNYLASICHTNQILRNAGEEDKMTKLPFGLHHSTSLTKFVLFLGNNASYGINTLYLITLTASGFYGAHLFFGASVGMLAVNYFQQRGWFPAILEKPYFFLTTILLIAANVQLDTWYGLALLTANVGFFIWDYVQTHLRGAQSASSQFEIATPEHHVSLGDTLKDVPENQVINGAKAITHVFKQQNIRVTFNHFRQAYVLSDKLLGHHPKMTADELAEYSRLFNRLDFANQTIKDLITNQMVIHDKFGAKSDKDHCNDLGLAQDSTHEQVCIAYLRKEMQTMVEKLSVPDYKGLTSQQISTLYGHARLLLDYLKTNANSQTKQTILISLALRTGTQCLRAYLDEFTALSHQFSIPNASTELSLADRAVLAAQMVREQQFTKYYYEFIPYLRYFDPLSYLLSNDVNEYHTKENFTLTYGGYFYLQNPSLSIQTRDLTDLIAEKYYYMVFKSLSTAVRLKTLFSDYYNDNVLINEVLEGSYLSPIFQEWCQSISPTLYDKLVLDEYYMVDKHNPQVQALAKLMLVDLGIAEFEHPISQVIRDTLISLSTRLRLTISTAQQPQPGITHDGANVQPPVNPSPQSNRLFHGVNEREWRDTSLHSPTISPNASI